jgi:hypothetical protein
MNRSSTSRRAAPAAAVFVALFANVLAEAGHSQAAPGQGAEGEPRVVEDVPLAMPDDAAVNDVSLVVVEATLDAAGTVVDAQALSGAKPLIAEVVQNLKRWRFSRDGDRTAIVVYKFVVLPARRRTATGRGKYERSGNFVTVTDARVEPEP